MRPALALLLVCLAQTSSGSHVARGDDPALHRGVYEVRLIASRAYENPFLEASVQVTFTRPSGTEVAVDGFFDGGRIYRARAYCDVVGEWKWRSSSGDPALDGKSGTFRVVTSELKGKLRIHPRDPRQFAYDDGSWFLHIGDTGYRYVTATEPRWKEYIV